jgi:hypothetical protein
MCTVAFPPLALPRGKFRSEIVFELWIVEALDLLPIDLVLSMLTTSVALSELMRKQHGR